jgi:thymidylate kinase
MKIDFLLGHDLPHGMRHARHELPDHELAPLIAIIGCDGSGKSTLSADMRVELSKDGPIETCYLGTGTGDLGERIKHWPLIGAAIERKLVKKATQTRSKDAKIPGLPTALVVFGLSLLRRRRFRRMMALRARGISVITDRFPQTEVAGFYDGPGLSAARAGSRLVAWLAARERDMYLEMASHRPDVVIRLNIDVATAFARKPDHKPDLLARKVAVTPLLRFNDAFIVDLDSRRPYEEVRAKVLDIVRRVIGPGDRRISQAA